MKHPKTTLQHIALALAAMTLMGTANMSSANSFKLRLGAPTVVQLSEQVDKLEQELEPHLTPKEREELGRTKPLPVSLEGDDASVYSSLELRLIELNKLLDARRPPAKASAAKK